MRGKISKKSSVVQKKMSVRVLYGYRVDSTRCHSRCLVTAIFSGPPHLAMVGDVFFDLLLEETCVPLVFKSQFNIFPAFGNILFAIHDSDMVSKA